MITDNNAAGKAIPPHFQFQTSAQLIDTMRLWNNLIKFIPKIKGRFGMGAKQLWSIAFRMNPKSGMDDVEF